MDMSKLQEMMGQAQHMQAQMEQKIATTTAEASSGGGLVTARVNGKKELLRLRIDPTAMSASGGDVEMLEDLITAAVNEAGRQVDAQMQSASTDMLGGMDLGRLLGRTRAASWLHRVTSALLCLGASACAAQGAIVTPITSPRQASDGSRAQDAPMQMSLQQTVQRIVQQHHGSVALYARQLNTGNELAIDADKPVQTASTIKLALLWTLLRNVALGKAHWGEPLMLRPGEPVGGSGILHFFDTPLTLTLKDVATMMVIVSDNTATNLLIDRFPIADVDANMAVLGLPNTWLYKKVSKPATGPMPADQPKFGLGKTTPREIATLMERMGRCDLNLPGQPRVDQAKADTACTVALDMLRNQFYRDTIPRYLESLDSTEVGSGIASKTGSLDATRSDVAIIAGKSGPIVLAVYTYDNADKGWSVDNEGEVAVAKIAKAIVTAWSPQGIDGKHLVPGLGLHSFGSAAPPANASK